MTTMTQENQEAFNVLLEYAGSSSLLERALRQALHAHGTKTTIGQVVEEIQKLKRETQESD